MSGHNSASRFVVADLKRRWTVEEKKAIVAESSTTSTSVSAVARKHNLTPALLFRWRRELGVQRPWRRQPKETRFVPACLSGPTSDADDDATAGAGIVEIELRSGLKLRLEAATLSRVLDILEAR